MVWVKRFLDKYGYALKRNIFYQDNQNKTKLESNGKKTCGEKSRYTHIRFFHQGFVKKGEVRVDTFSNRKNCI